MQYTDNILQKWLVLHNIMMLDVKWFCVEELWNRFYNVICFVRF